MNYPERIVQWPPIPDPATIPEGICHCGCGQETKPAGRDSKYKTSIGPRHFYLRGHNGRKGWTYKVDPITGCWNWLRRIQAFGYGSASLGRFSPPRSLPAHKLFFELCYGKVPEGLELDHLCRNKSCVNPNHVQPVTRVVNRRRRGGTKLSVELAGQIRVLFAHGFRQKSIARFVGVDKSTIKAVLEGETWKEVE